MSQIGQIEGLRRMAGFRQRLHHRTRLRDRHVGVLLPMHHQQGRGHGRRHGHRRHCRQPPPDLLVVQIAHPLLPRMIGSLADVVLLEFPECRPVRNRHHGHSAAKSVRGLAQGEERAVPAIAGPHDGQPVRISHSLGDHPLGHVDDVVLDLAPDLVFALVQKSLAVTGGAPVVDLQHRVAPVGEELHDPVKAPGIPHPGSAMDLGDQGKVPFPPAARQCQVSMQRQAIPRLAGDRIHVRHLLGFDPGGATPDKMNLPGNQVDGGVDPRFAGRVGQPERLFHLARGP